MSYYEDYTASGYYQPTSDEPFASTSSTPYPSSSFPANSQAQQYTTHEFPSQYPYAHSSFSIPHPPPEQPYLPSTPSSLASSARSRQSSWASIAPPGEPSQGPFASYAPPVQQRRASSASHSRTPPNTASPAIRYDPYHYSIPSSHSSLPQSHSLSYLPPAQHYRPPTGSSTVPQHPSPLSSHPPVFEQQAPQLLEARHASLRSSHPHWNTPTRTSTFQPHPSSHLPLDLFDPTSQSFSLAFPSEPPPSSSLSSNRHSLYSAALHDPTLLQSFPLSDYRLSSSSAYAEAPAPLPPQPESQPSRRPSTATDAQFLNQLFHPNQPVNHLAPPNVSPFAHLPTAHDAEPHPRLHTPPPLDAPPVLQGPYQPIPHPSFPPPPAPSNPSLPPALPPTTFVLPPLPPSRSSTPPPPSLPPPTPPNPLPLSEEDATSRTLALAARKRAEHVSSSTPLPYFPARARQSGFTLETTAPSAGGSSSPSGSVAAGGLAAGREKRTAKLVETRSTCWTCGVEMALLRLRGKDVTNLLPRAKGTCLACLPVDTVSSAEREGEMEEEEEGRKYEDTLSAAIDGLSLGEGRKGLGGKGVEGGKKGGGAYTGAFEKDLEWPQAFLQQTSKCDVCTRILGISSVSSAPLDAALPVSKFTVETICSRCISLYAPCSDCGGGGGRLTSGRWRSKELFPDGRKTCQLSHARFPALADLSFHASSTRTLSPTTLSTLEPQLKKLYFNARLNMCCRPEALEEADGLASSFEEAERHTIDTWSLMAPLLLEHLDPFGTLQRYLTLCYAAPRGRRPGNSTNKKQVDKEPELTAFGIYEVDFEHGAGYFVVVAPWLMSGAAFDSISLIGEEATRFAKEDRQRINVARAAAGLGPVKEIGRNWVLNPFKRDSKLSLNLERRGYIILKDYLRLHPTVSPSAFPPIRPIWLPRQYVRSLRIYVRHLDSPEDLGGPPAQTKKKREACSGRKGKRVGA
ncbi:hypothetical protein JCM8547_004305 [Rhodosporidiobolus lusitaniae]